ncbi:MAG: hypothetical protein ACLFQZ_01820 [Spirochaetaceae bacterium]
MSAMSSSRLRRLLALFLSLSVLLTPVWAQEEDGAEEGEEETDEVEPVPYSPDEFPGWARDLRRAEIIALGAFPVALILTNVGYRLGRFTVESARRGEFAQEYAPAFTTPEQRARLTEQQQVGLLLTAGAVSLGIAALDYLLGRREDRRGQRRE